MIMTQQYLERKFFKAFDDFIEVRKRPGDAFSKAMLRCIASEEDDYHLAVARIVRQGSYEVMKNAEVLDHVQYALRSIIEKSGDAAYENLSDWLDTWVGDDWNSAASLLRKQRATLTGLLIDSRVWRNASGDIMENAEGQAKAEGIAIAIRFFDRMLEDLNGWIPMITEVKENEAK